MEVRTLAHSLGTVWVNTTDYKAGFGIRHHIFYETLYTEDQKGLLNSLWNRGWGVGSVTGKVSNIWNRMIWVLFLNLLSMRAWLCHYLPSPAPGSPSEKEGRAGLDNFKSHLAVKFYNSVSNPVPQQKSNLGRERTFLVVGNGVQSMTPRCLTPRRIAGVGLSPVPAVIGHREEKGNCN